MNEKMTSENYVEYALNTDCKYDEECIKRITEKARILHAAMGMVTEAAEMLDMLKKHFFYAKSFDVVNAKEECGDQEWYIALAIDEMRTTMNDILTTNIAKLKLRYPNKFNGEDAINRDVKAERVLLEGGIPDNNNWIKDRFETDKQHNLFVNESKIIFGTYGITTPSEVSKRGKDWLLFAAKVLEHIENYTIGQYGDKGKDQVTNWSLKERLNQITKYIFRNGKNARENQDELDLLKAAHYCQLALNKLKGDV